MRVRYLPKSLRDLLTKDRITFNFFYDQVNKTKYIDSNSFGILLHRNTVKAYSAVDEPVYKALCVKLLNNSVQSRESYILVVHLLATLSQIYD